MEPQLEAATKNSAQHRPGLNWDEHKNTISRLYDGHELKEVMAIMDSEHNFRATIKQFKSQITKWGLDKKRIKAVEYKAILKKRRTRSGKATSFTLHGQDVADTKILRFETRMLKAGKISKTDTFDDVPTPHSLTWRTPKSQHVGTSAGLDNPAYPFPESSTSHSPPLSSSRIQLSCLQSSPSTMGGFSSSILGSLASPPVLFRGTVDDLMSQVGIEWAVLRGNPTPLPIETPNIPVGIKKLDSANPLTPSNIPPLRLVRRPSVAAFEWWTFFRDFSESSSKVLEHELGEHKVEKKIASFAKRVSNYNDQGLVNKYLSRFNDCTGNCAVCLSCADISATMRNCQIIRTWKGLSVLFESQELKDLSELRALFAHSLHDILSATKLAPVVIFTIAVQIWTTFGSEIANSDIQDYLETALVPSNVLDEYAIGNWALRCALHGYWKTSLRSLQYLFGTRYENAVKDCMRPNTGACSMMRPFALGIGDRSQILLDGHFLGTFIQSSKGLEVLEIPVSTRTSEDCKRLIWEPLLKVSLQGYRRYCEVVSLARLA